MKKLILISFFGLFGCWAVQAQTADSTAVVEAQADTTVIIGDGGNPRGVELPENLLELMQAEKYKEALAEYLKFRPTISDDFLATYADKDFYGGMSAIFPDKAEYKENYETAKKKLQITYGKRVEVILMELDELPTITDQDRIRIYTKVIEADSTYTNAYLDRGYALMNEGKMQEACHDFSKHPDYDKMPWKAECESYFEQEKAAATEEK
ncbi:hypothetical protein HDR62_04890 [bacterium]|nr:hypothetical protein [bacterium]